MKIANNITALSTYNSYSANNKSIAGSVKKLSTGYQINSAADNAAGLAISEKMRAQIRGLNQAASNSQDAISLVQTAEGALQSTHDILQRMRELAVQSASDTNETTIDRAAIQAEFEQLQAEINDTASKTRFNDQNLIDGTFSAKKLISGTTTDLKGPGMTVGIGNAAAGSYTFKVEVEEITAKTDATTCSGALVLDSIESSALSSAGSKFDINTDAKGAMYNGNYTLSVTNTDNLAAVEFTLTGDNGLTFTTTIDMSSTSDVDLSSGEDLELDFDGFGKLTFALDKTIGGDGSGDTTTPAAAAAASQSQIDALGSIFDGIKVSVSDGKDQVEATYGTFASITGGEKVQLAVGDSSVSFSNGITVNFNKLTASDLDTYDKTAGAGKGTNYENVFGDEDSTIEVIARKGQALTIQTGANQGDELKLNIDKMDTDFLGITGAKVSSQEAASAAITSVNKAINQVSTQRATLGAIQNRIEYKIDNLDTSAENLTSAESNIRDVDMASEMTKFTNANILQQASTAMLAQANSLPQNVLSLLG